MGGSTANRTLLLLSLIGGLFTTMGVVMASWLMYATAWVISITGGHPIGDPPNFPKILDSSNGISQLDLIQLDLIHLNPVGAVPCAFAAGAIAVYFVSKSAVGSFLQNPSTSSEWPRKGFFFGLLCGLASCVLFTSVSSVVGIVLDSFKQDPWVWVGLLLFGPLHFSFVALILVGLPVALIGGTVGSLIEVVVRQHHRSASR